MYRRVLSARDDVPGRFAVEVDVAVRLGGLRAGFEGGGDGTIGSSVIPTPMVPPSCAFLPPLTLPSLPAGRFKFCPRAMMPVLKRY